VTDVGIGWRHPHYAQVLQEQPAVDFLEVHSENFFADGGAAMAVLEQGRALYPVSLHGVGLSLGSAIGLDPWHLDQLDRLVKRIDPVRVSDHASFARGQFQGNAVHASDLLPIPFSKEALQVLCDNLDQVQQRLQRRFMVENLSAYMQWSVAPGDTALQETDFLTTMARRSGCLLLVDVNNIYVNALNASRNGDYGDPEAACRQWLNAIDPALVGELHLAGHVHINDANGVIVIDDHGSRVCDAVWRLYGHAIARFGPVPTLIEWDTDLPALDVLLDEATHAGNVARAARTGVPA
jgi:uncharacterized protein (UPF0276 family)